MIWGIIDILIAVFDMYIVVSFYMRRLSQKASLMKFILAFLCFVTTIYMLRLCNIPGLVMILISVAVCFSLTVFFAASWKQRIFYPLVLVSMEIVAEIVAGLTLQAFSGLTAAEITASPQSVEFLIGLVTSKLVFFLFVRVLCRLHVQNDHTLPIVQWVIVMLVPATSIIISIGLAIASSNYIMRNPSAPFMILIGVLGINALVFILYDELSAQSKTLLENERLKYRMESDMRQYGIVIEQSKEIASMLHDAKKHADHIHELLLIGEHATALSYVSGLQVSAKSMDTNHIASNKVLNNI